MKTFVWFIPFLYFAMSWFFPWQIMQWDSTISVSYLFDILFVVIISFTFRLFDFHFVFHLKGFASRFFAIIGAAALSLFMITLFNLKSPFKYVDHLILQVLILAPLIEEFIFRHAFFGLFDKVIKEKKYNLLLNSLLFSLSHLPAIWILPEEFKGFIIIQLLYTFLLGWLCAKSRLKTGTIYEPIILHFTFNFIFYMAVIKGVI